MQKPNLLFLLSLLALIPLDSLLAENWPNWRGPHFNGASTEKDLPTVFSKTQGVAWETTLPGEGASTPVVWDDSIFLTSVDEKADAVVGICLSAKSGKILWSVPFGKGVRIDERSTYAGSSPVTDGKTVWFFSGNGDLAAYDFEGNQLWHRNIEKDYGDFAFQWTFSSSPQLYHGLLYLQVLQRDTPVNGRGLTNGPIESYLLALDPATGETKWKHVRPSDALQESREAFSTPIPVMHDGREELVISGGDCLTGHDPATGKELWRWGTYNPQQIGHWRLVPSPVYGQGVHLVCAPKGDPIYAIKAGGSGSLFDSAKLWASEGKEVTADVPTPLFYDGYFYILNGRNKFLSCVHPISGNIIWSRKIDAKTKLESSPTGADGKIYFMSQLGEVFVYSAGADGGEVLNATTFGSTQSVNIRASIVPANKKLYIRTDNVLYAIEK
ncbi:MAG: PQQ-binding-like beta-propeller repeat protein [Verrucomicrobiales bacterium]|nr:PQQ-binding-like beta-propeller repeat protein [Verrucomicrobiales bacterium]MBP9225595.1 PQQ-binding-like beta-propeller repeat protein [Verrucomicrobiales bacterium]HQZ27405.1 PQQ-binding-like beta-propeller repeat protein [Verrucomicrobiales bacterium]